jgi:biotin synthase
MYFYSIMTATNNDFSTLLQKPRLTRSDLCRMIAAQGDDLKALLDAAAKVKTACVGDVVYFRGLIEYSNRCQKNCFYCGVRAGNTAVNRYELTDDEVVEAARFARDNRYGSIVIQSGERADAAFTTKITTLLDRIHRETNSALRITLSMGEQSEATYRTWFDHGANRYLLRIETSSEELYKKLHPADGNHLFRTRIEALHTLKHLNYQVGTGVMIGLPFQSIDDLAGDLEFFRSIDVDMIGMGPYIEHEETPLYEHRALLPSRQDRFILSLKMVATLRILMKNVNIAATTAMQAIDPEGREKAILAGANVVMPNLTPKKYRRDYLLYDDKPCLDEDASLCGNCLAGRIASTGNRIGQGEWGDSAHFRERNMKN